MNLHTNPYLLISPPKLTGKSDQFNIDIQEQWKTWKKKVKQVRELYVKFCRKKTAIGVDSKEFKSFIGTLQAGEAYVQKSIRDEMSLTAAVEGDVITEAVRRFLINETLPELSDIDEKGYLPWEKDLE